MAGLVEWIPRRPAWLLAVVAVLALPGTGRAGAAPDPGSTPSGFTIQVHLAVQDGATDDARPLKGRLLAQPPGDSAAEPVSVSLSQARTLPLVLPAEGIWTLSVEAAGFWSAGDLAWPDREEVTLRLLPTGPVTGRVAFPEGTDPPASLELRFAPAGELRDLGSQSMPGHGSVDCPLDADHRWHCEIPTGPSDLHLHATGFASVFRFDVSIQAGEPKDLGTLALRPGASIVGSVDLGSAQGATSSVRVELTTAGRDSLAGPQSRQLEALTRSTEPDERGFFQFRDLQPGIYQVLATAGDLAPAVLERLEVREGRESRILAPLVLTPLASIEVVVRPPLPPRGDRWHVRLLQPETSSEQITGTMDATGTWRHAGMRPGSYLLRVEDEYRARWHEQRYEIEARSPPVEVHLPIVQVAGLVTFGGEPMRTRLLFERPAGGEVVGLVSSLDGDFSGDLPHPGEWRIFRLGRQREKHVVDRVRIEPRDDGEPTWIEIELPETRIDGRVVDGAGRPVGEARVSAWRLGGDRAQGTSDARSDDDGRFLFRGLREGTYALDALAGHEGSAREQVELREGVDTEVEIRLLGEVRFAGRVMGPDGRPVAAAEVYAYPRLATPRQAPLIQGITDLSGDFVLPVPLDTLELDVLLLPPGYAARLLRLPFDPRTVSDAPRVFPVDTVGGTLHLRPGGSLQDALDATLQSGPASMFFRPLQRWARLHGSSPSPADGWWLPQFAPGPYRLCSQGGTPCDEGDLLPGGVLMLETPVPSTEAEAEAGEEP